MSIKELVKKYGLPQRIQVNVFSEGEDICAEIQDLAIYTQAKSGAELWEMLNDAIFTHFEIEEADRQFSYVPLSDEHLGWEAAIRNLVKLEKSLSFRDSNSAQWSLSSSCVGA